MMHLQLSVLQLEEDTQLFTLDIVVRACVSVLVTCE